MEIKKGRYRHFKGGEFEVLDIVRHSETLEELILYRHCDGKDTSLWVRPVEMFLETVERDGRRVPRFTYLGE